MAPHCVGVCIATQHLPCEYALPSWLSSCSVCPAGQGTYGQLGNAANAVALVPEAVFGDHAFAQIACGATHTCGILVNGSALCWGECGAACPAGRRSAAHELDQPVCIVHQPTAVSLLCRRWCLWNEGQRGEQQQSQHSSRCGWRLCIPKYCSGLSTYVCACCQLRGI